jgi:hypothetical protein
LYRIALDIDARTVRTTDHLHYKRRRPLGHTRFAGRLGGSLLAFAILLSVAGCSRAEVPTVSTSNATKESSRSAHMAGPAPDVRVTQEAFNSKPNPPVLTTPESAVRSYLDWASYAYRIGQSKVAAFAMTAYEWVRVDAYVQYNAQNRKLVDQKLESIEFGKPSIEASRATLAAKETWKYRYVSIEKAGKTLQGPYSASYDTTYTLVNQADGGWLVDSVAAKPKGEVK